MPKIVFSTSLDRVGHNARLVQGDVGTVLEELRQEFAGDIDLGGPNLAGQFVRRRLVDEYRLVLDPGVLGAGTSFWPNLDAPLLVRLVEAPPSPIAANVGRILQGRRFPFPPDPSRTGGTTNPLPRHLCVLEYATFGAEETDAK